MADYTFLPWLRQGLIGAVGAGTVTAGRVTLSVDVQVSGGAGGTRSMGVLMFGPGDVTGFDTRQVIRTDPPNFSSDFEMNYFPVVEFDRPDFPWLFSPEAPGATNQLKPWLCLVVVVRREGIELKAEGQRPLPVLTIADRAHAELPDLSEAWAWAHAQVGGVTTDADLDAALQGQPERTLSRLLCPRRLKPKTPYFGCVVPTYLGGVRAGLGEPVVDAEVLQPAWTLGADQPNDIRLPVYFHWEFSTGAAGDFESLVWQLERRRLTFADVGTRKLAIGSAGYGLPASAAVDLEGALAPDVDPAARFVGPSPSYQTRLRDLVNEAAVSGPLPVLAPPIYGRWHALQRAIPDPIGGGRLRDRPWLRQINLDPRYRAAAGIGAQIVREQQEQLMASAWDQVGEIERANQVVRQAQLARAGSRSMHEQRLGALDATTFLLMTAAVQPRIPYRAAQSGNHRTARGHVRASALPMATTSVQFRRAIRPRGRIARRFGIATAAQRRDLVAALNRRKIGGAPARWPTPPSLVTMEQLVARGPCAIVPRTIVTQLLERWPLEPMIAPLTNALAAFTAHQAEINAFDPRTLGELRVVVKLLSSARTRLVDLAGNLTRPGADIVTVFLTLYPRAIAELAEALWRFGRFASGFQPAPPPAIADPAVALSSLPNDDSLRALLFGVAAVAHLRHVEPCAEPPVRTAPPLDIDELKGRVHERLNPATTIPARVASLVTAPGWTADTLEPVLAAPEFPTPMYQALAAMSKEWLLPGLERVPANTLALLTANKRFIEAFMVGLNHEMSRELLWRGYPTDQRGTYFRQFWDPSGQFPPPQNETGKDMPPIDEWGDAALGDSLGRARDVDPSMPAAAPTPIVLLVRGELLKRYPRAVIYLARAAWTVDGNGNKHLPRDPTNVEQYPVFRGELSPDVQLLGFTIDPATARGTSTPSTTTNDAGAGWFVVLQQQPTEPRYGLDEAPPSGPLGRSTWRDLSWVDVNLTEDAGYIRLAPGLKPSFPANAQTGGKKPWKWSPDGDSAQIACITLQMPARIAVHASDFL
jgi:hypothetical protein